MRAGDFKPYCRMRRGLTLPPISLRPTRHKVRGRLGLKLHPHSVDTQTVISAAAWAPAWRIIWPMDNVSASVRSRTMAAVLCAGNRSTEWALRARLVRGGFRGWRLNAKDVLGRPDFVFDDERLAVFVDGCFWHGCPSCHRCPSSNRDYWIRKVGRNKSRDNALGKS